MGKQKVMYRYACQMSYDGTGFYGWQSQKTSSNTIQGKIEGNLSKVLNQKIEVVGCGRTDAGVHAQNYVFHFDADQMLDLPLLIYKMNKMNGTQMMFHKCKQVSSDFHSRFDALSRSYIYRIKCGKAPFDNRFAWEYVYNDVLSLDKLNKAAKVLLDYGDFYTFCKTKTDVQTTLCKLEQSKWSLNKETDTFEYHVTADRFLRGMIRLIVGACLNVNRGKMSTESLHDALSNKKRLDMDWSVPAKGLMLHSIKYADF